jgi:hypothetical protein
MKIAAIIIAAIFYDKNFFSADLLSGEITRIKT